MATRTKHAEDEAAKLAALADQPRLRPAADQPVAAAGCRRCGGTDFRHGFRFTGRALGLLLTGFGGCFASFRAEELAMALSRPTPLIAEVGFVFTLMVVFAPFNVERVWTCRECRYRWRT